MTRQDFNKLAATFLLGAVSPIGCSSRSTNPTYEELVKIIWRHSDPVNEQGSELLRELVRYATLAANSHNTQPWKFRISANKITILPDFSRRCAAVDPDDHHLFASLGCATENLVLAAKAFGFEGQVSVDGASSTEIQIDLIPMESLKTTMFQAIPERQCTRANYDGQPVPSDQLDVLKTIAQDNGVMAQIFTDKNELEKILEYVVAGNTAQMNDKAFVKELKDWIRFSRPAVVKHRDGLFTASSGNPTFPNWFGKMAFNIFFKTRTENDKYRDHIRSSAGVVAFISKENTKESWINVGRCYQRFALQSTALGLRHAFINQAVEVPQVRAQFANYLGIGDQRTDLLVRFGYGPELPRSLRRPIQQVIV